MAVGKCCEDSCWAQVEQSFSGLPVLALFVADGAGSAARGGDGAEIAIQSAVEFLAARLCSAEFLLSTVYADACVVAVREKLFGEAARAGLTPRDFACTFLGLISWEAGTLVFQIGDGGVVVDVGCGLEVPVVPMSGEYANMTSFITDANATQQMVTKLYPGIAQRAAVFSDGLQRLALNMATNTAHEPFFATFFKVLATALPGQEDSLHNALVRFLQSTAVNERTDDDKTLTLAVLVR